MDQKQKLQQILAELRTAEQNILSALNHNRDLQTLIEQEQKRKEKV